jgi:alpha-1,6-mannosyltransferase
MVAVMFACMWLVGVLAVQRAYGLGMPSPHSRLLTLGGFLSGCGRLLGISSLSRAGMTAIYMPLIIVIFAAYAWALVLIARQGKGLSSMFIIGASAALCLWVLFVPPILAKDLFNYASYGKALAFHAKNPYIVVPRNFGGDPVLQYIDWKGTISVYGPFFNYFAALTTLVARQSATSNIIAFKLVAFGFFTGSLFMVDSLARRLHPRRRALILAAVAWNPIVIIQLVGGGHNDTMMIFFIVLGFLLYRQERPVLAIASTVLAVLVKTTAVFVLVPMLVLFLRQNARWTLRKYAEALGVIVALPLAMYLPVWPGTAGFKKIISVGTDYSAVSVPSLIRGYLSSALRGLGVRASSAGSLGITGTRLLFMLTFLILGAVFTYKARDLDSLIFYSGAILFAFMMCTTWLMPWYAGLVGVVMMLSGSYLMVGAGVGLTFVMSLYGRGINGWPDNLFPVMLLLMTVGVLALALRKWVPSLEKGRAVEAEPEP